MKSPYPSEAQEQTQLFQWASYMQRIKWPELELMHHIANGEARSAITGARLKAQGVKPGVPDIFLPVARCGYHGLYIEMKRQQGGVLSVAQRNMIAKLTEQGYKVEVCKGFQQAVEVIEKYMDEIGV